MFDIWIGEVDSTTLFIIAAVLFVFPVQLLLCFKAKKSLLNFCRLYFLLWQQLSSLLWRLSHRIGMR